MKGLPTRRRLATFHLGLFSSQKSLNTALSARMGQTASRLIQNCGGIGEALCNLSLNRPLDKSSCCRVYRRRAVYEHEPGPFTAWL
jgi:hypothetical protein